MHRCMKSILTISLLATLTCGLLFPSAGQAQTPFTYQGKLENSGTPYTGTVQIRLGLYTVASGLTALRQEVMTNVSVASGIFTVTPSTFVAADFPGAPRWLQIDVSGDAGATYTTLNPRQQVTHTPYAIHAKQAETATTITGTVPATQISGFISPSSLGAGTINQTLSFSPVSGAPFTVGGATKVTNLNSDLFDGLDSTAFLRTTGGTISGTFTLGSATGTVISLEEAGTMRLKPGALGSKITFGDGNYCTIGESLTEDDTMVLTANRINIGTVTTQYPKGGFLDFGFNTRQMLNLWGAEYGIGVQGDTQYFRSNNNYAWFKGGEHDDGTYNAGTGGTAVMTLNGGGELDLKGTSCGYALVNRNDQAKRWEMYSRNSGPTDQLAFYSSSAGGDIAAFSPNGDLYLVGNLTAAGGVQVPSGQSVRIGTTSIDIGLGPTIMDLNADAFVFKTISGNQIGSISSAGNLDLDGSISTTVLTIRGGADVAEPFEMTRPDEMEPGSVVIIDEDNAGKLKLSTAACDTRVAGIISGAGGVKPGLRLHQEGVLEGDHHVALSGRVYVKADASTSPIRPGDLLTTSDTPGHAMKVSHPSEAQGAILGKAMSKLDRDTGLVLVLVTLQ